MSIFGIPDNAPNLSPGEDTMVSHAQPTSEQNEGRGQDLIDRLEYRVNNPSAWSDGFDQGASDLIAEAVQALRSEAVVTDAMVPLHVYESAVKGRADFRQALREARGLRETDVVELLSKSYEASGLSYDKFGESMGLSGEFIRSVLNGKRRPSKAILDVLGIEEVTAYRALTASQPQLRDREITDLMKAAKNLLPYLEWTIGDESPGHHPTMPSAVAAFQSALIPALEVSAPAEARVSDAEWVMVAMVERLKASYIAETGSTMWPTDSQFRAMLLSTLQPGCEL